MFSGDVGGVFVFVKRVVVELGCGVVDVELIETALNAIASGL